MGIDSPDSTISPFSPSLTFSRFFLALRETPTVHHLWVDEQLQLHTTQQMALPLALALALPPEKALSLALQGRSIPRQISKLPLALILLPDVTLSLALHVASILVQMTRLPLAYRSKQTHPVLQGGRLRTDAEMKFRVILKVVQCHEFLFKRQALAYDTEL